MSRSKRNSIRLIDIRGGVYTNVELMSDRIGPYIQLLRLNGVNTSTRFCADVRWSGVIGDDEYFDALCNLDAFMSADGSISVCASLYDGYGGLHRCFDAPLSYYERQLIIKPEDIGMSILINVK